MHGREREREGELVDLGSFVERMGDGGKPDHHQVSARTQEPGTDEDAEKKAEG